MKRLILMAPMALLLAGCASESLKGSIAGGECRIFERPSYAVRGVKPYDQDWIDRQVEGGVGGCGWHRPAPRPAEIDAPGAATVKPVPVKRRGIMARIKSAVQKTPIAAPPIAPVPASPSEAVPDATPPVPVPEAKPHDVPAVPPPPPRTRLELLLDPSGPAVTGTGR
ncbi:hypothetical protein PMI42_04884 [Bradyrhizobium sp. YR681]|uniref:hypothetical protein n=1 Tax=Bradyrhizobium sp. YR681 TaxID=1144344 RepID=UPI00027114A1|nr:hypothetical protein [Bradyrhizobium sp. YR681]EJN11869.1 hypothetical protein PMI42_04884 [Bradyrhizobium sp. YR681]